MYITFNAAYVNALLSVSLGTTPTYVLTDVIGVVEPLATNLYFKVKSILTSRTRWQSR